METFDNVVPPGVREPQMPKGVEHTTFSVAPPVIHPQVREPQMPKGVEHAPTGTWSAADGSLCENLRCRKALSTRGCLSNWGRPWRRCENLRCRKALSTSPTLSEGGTPHPMREPQMPKGVEHSACMSFCPEPMMCENLRCRKALSTRLRK